MVKKQNHLYKQQHQKESISSTSEAEQTVSNDSMKINGAKDISEQLLRKTDQRDNVYLDFPKKHQNCTNIGSWEQGVNEKCLVLLPSKYHHKLISTIDQENTSNQHDVLDHTRIKDKAIADSLEQASKEYQLSHSSANKQQVYAKKTERFKKICRKKQKSLKQKYTLKCDRKQLPESVEKNSTKQMSKSRTALSTLTSINNRYIGEKNTSKTDMTTGFSDIKHIHESDKCVSLSSWWRRIHEKNRDHEIKIKKTDKQQKVSSDIKCICEESKENNVAVFNGMWTHKVKRILADEFGCISKHCQNRVPFQPKLCNLSTSTLGDFVQAQRVASQTSGHSAKDDGILLSCWFSYFRNTGHDIETNTDTKIKEEPTDETTNCFSGKEIIGEGKKNISPNKLDETSSNRHTKATTTRTIDDVTNCEEHDTTTIKATQKKSTANIHKINKITLPVKSLTKNVDDILVDSANRIDSGGKSHKNKSVVHTSGKDHHNLQVENFKTPSFSKCHHNICFKLQRKKMAINCCEDNNKINEEKNNCFVLKEGSRKKPIETNENVQSMCKTKYITHNRGNDNTMMSDNCQKTISNIFGHDSDKRHMYTKSPKSHRSKHKLFNSINTDKLNGPVSNGTTCDNAGEDLESLCKSIEKYSTESIENVNSQFKSADTSAAQETHAYHTHTKPVILASISEFPNDTKSDQQSCTFKTFENDRGDQQSHLNKSAHKNSIPDISTLSCTDMNCKTMKGHSKEYFSIHSTSRISEDDGVATSVKERNMYHNESCINIDTHSAQKHNFDSAKASALNEVNDLYYINNQPGCVSCGACTIACHDCKKNCNRELKLGDDIDKCDEVAVSINVSPETEKFFEKDYDLLDTSEGTYIIGQDDGIHNAENPTNTILGCAIQHFNDQMSSSQIVESYNYSTETNLILGSTIYEVDSQLSVEPVSEQNNSSKISQFIDNYQPNQWNCPFGETSPLKEMISRLECGYQLGTILHPIKEEPAEEDIFPYENIPSFLEHINYKTQTGSQRQCMSDANKKFNKELIVDQIGPSLVIWDKL